MWIGANSQTNVEIQTELFGMGSGDFLRQSEANDAMSDQSSDGRWVGFSFSDASSYVILETGRQTPEHLQNQPFFNKVEFFWKNVSFKTYFQDLKAHPFTAITLNKPTLGTMVRDVTPCKVLKLNELLKSLEDLGEVNVGVADHKLAKDEGGNFSIKPLVPVCFVLDAPKNKRKKHKADSSSMCLCILLMLDLLVTCIPIIAIFHIWLYLFILPLSPATCLSSSILSCSWLRIPARQRML